MPNKPSTDSDKITLKREKLAPLKVKIRGPHIPGQPRGTYKIQSYIQVDDTTVELYVRFGGRLISVPVNLNAPHENLSFYLGEKPITAGSSFAEFQRR